MGPRKRADWPRWLAVGGGLLLAAGGLRAANLTVNGGTLNVSANGTYDGIIVNQNGTLNQAGFALNATQVVMPDTSGTGTYNLSGNGTLAISNYMDVGRSGGGTSGVFTQSDSSTVTVGLLRVGASALGTGLGSPGTYTLNGGTLNTASIIIGSSTAPGTFTQNGGTHNANVTLAIGATNSSAQSAIYNLNGGLLQVGTGGVSGSGLSGTRIFNINGGTLRAAGDSATFVSGLTQANVIGTFTVDTSNRIVTIGQQLLHGGGVTDGGLTKYGSGFLRLIAANTYNGTTDVREGKLILSGAGQPGAPGSALVVQGGATLDLSGVSIAPGYFAAGHNSLIVNGSGAASTLTVGTGNISNTFQNGPMSGNIALTKIGTGIHTIAALHTYTGTTQVSAGTLYLDSTLGTPVVGGSASITIAPGAALGMYGPNRNALLSSIPLQVAGTLAADGPAHTLRNLALNGGTVAGSNPEATYGNFVFDGLQTTSSGTSLISAPKVQLLTTAGGVVPNFQVNDGTLTISSQLTDTNFNGSTYANAGGLTKSGPGTLVLSGSNLYSGETTVNAGTLQFAGAGSVYANGTRVGSTLVAKAGAVLSFARTDTFGNGFGSPVTTVTLDGARAENPGNFFNTLRDLTLRNGAELRSLGGAHADAQGFQLRGTVTVSGTLPSSLTAPSGTNNALCLDGAAGATVFAVEDVTGNADVDLLVSAPLKNGFNGGGIAPSGLTKSGAGTMQLSSANTFTGGTTVAGGVLAISQAGALGTTGAIAFTGGTLRFDGVAPDLSARFGSVASGQVIRLDTSGGTLTLASPLQGAGGLLKTGLGTLVLTGSSSYGGGTTISAGTLQLGDGISLNGLVVGNIANHAGLVFANPNAQSYGGAISGSGGLTKNGAGDLTLSGSHSYGGLTSVNAGGIFLTSTGSLAGALSVASGASVRLDGSVGGLVSVTGTVRGEGSLNGGLTVQTGGLVSRTAAGSLTVNGAITNHGTMVFSGGAVLLAGGATSFVNHGVLDLIGAGAGTTLPPITGPGLVLTASDVRVKAAARDGATVTVTIDSYSHHTYRLQRSTSLTADTFQTVPGSDPQAGVTGNVLTFTDPAAPAGNVFYRVKLD